MPMPTESRPCQSTAEGGVNRGPTVVVAASMLAASVIAAAASPVEQLPRGRPLDACRPACDRTCSGSRTRLVPRCCPFVKHARRP
jgi:hypothetical protein